MLQPKLRGTWEKTRNLTRRPEAKRDCQSCSTNQQAAEAEADADRAREDEKGKSPFSAQGNQQF